MGIATIYVCMYVCMYVCVRVFLKITQKVIYVQIGLTKSFTYST